MYSAGGDAMDLIGLPESGILRRLGDSERATTGRPLCKPRGSIPAPINRNLMKTITCITALDGSDGIVGDSVAVVSSRNHQIQQPPPVTY